MSDDLMGRLSQIEFKYAAAARIKGRENRLIVRELWKKL
jgi:hypothetical protein